jgi:hypothetical protein
MNEIQELQDQHYRGRAQNAIQDYLVRKLLVPKVYLDAVWDGWKLDVLAIDRAGVGDVHGVRLVKWESGHLDNHGYSIHLVRSVSEAIKEFADFPGHFRYLAVICIEPNKQKWIVDQGIIDLSLAPDGVGRVGILFVNVAEENSTVEVLLKPERFRSSQQIIDLTDKYVAEHTPNWEVRE